MRRRHKSLSLKSGKQWQEGTLLRRQLLLEPKSKSFGKKCPYPLVDFLFNTSSISTYKFNEFKLIPSLGCQHKMPL
jgi:hypothetical protein